jgi:hypothetical protein
VTVKPDLQVSFLRPFSKRNFCSRQLRSQLGFGAGWNKSPQHY